MAASRRWLVLWLLPWLWLMPVPGHAQLNLSLAGTGEYQYNSNLFDVEKGFVEGGLPLSAPRGDSFYEATGTFGLKYQASQQSIFADATVSDFRYNYYSVLDHDEYRFDAGWNGKFLRDFDGNFEVLRVRTVVPFLYEIGTGDALLLTTDQREQGGIGWQFLPRWRIEGSSYTHDVDWPQPNAPDLELEESQGQVALKYLGTASLTSGASFAYIDGRYTGENGSLVGLNPTYRQTTESLVASYVGGHSSLTGQLGYSDRTSPGTFSAINSASGVTGLLAYQNQLTGKTSFNITASRAIIAFITDAGSELATTGALNVTWQATYKVAVTLGYAYTYGTFPDQGDNPPGSTRIDHYQTLQLRSTYQPLLWLLIKPFYGYQTRSSNVMGGTFDGMTAGVDLTVQWQHPASNPPPP